MGTGIRRLAPAAGVMVIALTAFAAPASAANGLFDRMWGADVIKDGGSGGFEICIAPTVCDSTSLGGDDDGEMYAPSGVATDNVGDVYVSDSGNNRISRYDPDGNLRRTWGRDVVAAGPGNISGTAFEICVPANGDICKAGTAGGTNGAVDTPKDLVVSETGLLRSVYVVDDTNDSVSQYTVLGNFLRSWGKDVAASGPGDTGTGFEVCVNADDVCQPGDEGHFEGELYSPMGIALEGSDVFVSSFVGGTVTRYSTGGDPEVVWGVDVQTNNVGTGFEVCTIGSGHCDDGLTTGTGTEGGELSNPRGMSADGNGVYVADWGNHRIQKYTVNGAFIRTWGRDVISGGSTTGGIEACNVAENCKSGETNDGTGAVTFPFDVTTDPAGDVYAATNTVAVQKYTQTGTWLRTWGANAVLSGPNETPSDGPEVCVVGTDICQEPGSGTEGGEFGNLNGVAAYQGLLFASDGDSYNRIQRFDDVPNPDPGGPPGGGPAPPAGNPGAKAAALAAALKKCKKIKKKAKKKKCKKKAKAKFA